jgi:S1-C subfamily serine protease
MRATWRKGASAATVALPETSGQGVLVSGGFVLTVAHAVPYDCSGGMALGDYHLVAVKPKTGPSFRLSVYAVEPVSDIAVLGEADNQIFSEDADLFEDFRGATEPVPVCAEEFGFDASKPVHVLTHRGTWLRGTTADARDGCGWLRTKRKIEGGTSGGPVVNDDGQLVGLVSHTCETPPFDGRMPRPHRSLPGWVWGLVQADQAERGRREPSR